MTGSVTVVVVSPTADRGVLGEALKPPAFQVLWAADEEQALSLLAGASGDLALVDVAAPGLDGRRLLSQLKCDSRLWHVPVMIMADAADVDVVADCLEAGADDYVLRPLHPALVGRRIEAFAARRRFQHLEAEYVKIFQQQAADLKELTRDLGERVLHQVSERDRLERLRRFLPPELVDLTQAEGGAALASDAVESGTSHR